MSRPPVTGGIRTSPERTPPQWFLQVRPADTGFLHVRLDAEFYSFLSCEAAAALVWQMSVTPSVPDSTAGPPWVQKPV